MAVREPGSAPLSDQLLISDWYGRVYALCQAKLRCTSDAEDATQETFMRAINGIDRLKNHDAIGAWLRGIARHVCVDFIRRQHSGSYENRPVEDLPSKNQPDETANELTNLIHQLPSPLREPILLHYYEDMTYDQIAQWIGVARSTVNERLSKARHQLRLQLTTPECRDEL